MILGVVLGFLICMYYYRYTDKEEAERRFYAGFEEACKYKEILGASDIKVLEAASGHIYNKNTQ